jgi:hypothetical protein
MKKNIHSLIVMSQPDYPRIKLHSTSQRLTATLQAINEGATLWIC